jgi:hypothetical protein
MTNFKKYFSSSLLGVSVLLGPQTELSHRRINPHTITVSGLSSGAMMAGQLMVAASDRIMGAAVLAGGVYGCAEGDPNKAKEFCMKTPEKISVDDLIKNATDLQARGEIPPLENLKNRKFYILHGTEDKTVLPASGKKLLEWAQRLFPSHSIHADLNIPAGHGFPTVDVGHDCAEAELPWLNKCGFDSARSLLQFFYGQPLKPGTAIISNLSKFNQLPFLSSKSMMAIDGYIYTPKSCQSAVSNCHLHIALHGCNQAPLVAEDAFIARAGYNDWAEANRIIVLYPSAKISKDNPLGCWDWWGYSGSDYLTRKAPQIQSLLKMVDYLAQ